MDLEVAGGLVIGTLLGTVYASLWWLKVISEREAQRLRLELDRVLEERSGTVETFPLGRSHDV